MMAAIPSDFKQNISISSSAEFHQKYSLAVNEGIISIADRVTRVQIVAFKTKSEEQQYRGDFDSAHMHQGILYFVLSSERYKTAKYVYSFDPDKKLIECIIAPLRNPHFFENLLVEFGSGFNTPGPQAYTFNGRGILTIYDLTQARGQREVKKHILEGGSSGGWDGSIDKKRREVCAFDHVTGKELTFPLKEERSEPKSDYLAL
jgi:hypothetical protein